MDIKTFNIKDFIDNYRSDIGDDREGRRKDTNEVFTPSEIIESMCAKIDDKDWADPSKTFLEPTFGNGNILLYIIWKRLSCGVPVKTVFETLYGTELMPDNVREAKARIGALLEKLGEDITEVNKLIDANLVCTDFFDWDYENWRPIKKQPESIPLF